MKQIRYPFEAVLAAVFWLLAYLLGRNSGGDLGAFLAPKVGYFTRYQKIAADNIKLVFPEMPPPERARLLKKVWQNFGRAICEYPHLNKLEPTDKRLIKIVGKLPNTAKPTIYFSAHLANWEVMGVMISKMLDKPIVIAERPQNNPWVRWMIGHFRRRGRIISAAKGKQVMRHFVRILAAGGNIAYLIDQRERGHKIKFLGHQAEVNSSLAALALRFSAQVVPARLERTATNGFILILEPPLALSDNETADSLLSKMYKRVEEWIYQTPSQWLWFHRRWRD